MLLRSGWAWCVSQSPVEQRIPIAIEGAAEADQDGEGGSELRGFDELQAARGDVRFLRELLLRQTRLLAQSPEVPAQGFELLLRNCAPLTADPFQPLPQQRQLITFLFIQSQPFRWIRCLGRRRETPQET